MPACEASELPLITCELDELGVLGIQVEHGRRRRTMNPAAGFARADNQCVTARLHRLLVLHAMEHEMVRLDRAGSDVANVMHDENLVIANGDTVIASQVNAYCFLCCLDVREYLVEE